MSDARVRARRRLAVVGVFALLTTAQASPWGWHDTDAPEPITAIDIPWYDALDASLGARVASNGAVSADLSLRWRLDAPAYLARGRADARDLALHAGALERQAWLRDQLEVVARGCEAAWRALQVALIDGLSDGELASFHTPETVRELALLRALLTLAVPTPSGVDPLAVCRLDDLVVDLRLDSDHPRVIESAASARLAERAVAALAAPAAPSLWLHADASGAIVATGEPPEPRAAVRVGLDLPLVVRVGTAELTLGSDGYVSDASLRWVHGVGSTARHPVRSAVTASDPQRELGAGLARHQLETALQRVETDRRWGTACGSTEAVVIASCLGRPITSLAHLDALLAAIDAEVTVLHRALAAIEVSGRALRHLMAPPR